MFLHLLIIESCCFVLFFWHLPVFRSYFYELHFFNIAVTKVFFFFFFNLLSVFVMTSFIRVETTIFFVIQ